MIKKILVSQPAPANILNSPFAILKDNFEVDINFIPFIKTEGISAKEFRQQRVDILAHTSIIFTSMNMVDNFFRICEESRITIPETMKYFCVTEAIALYLQKYIVYRKRKIFFGKTTFVELMEVIVKHSNDLFVLPVSEPHKPEITQMLKDAKINFTESVMSRTVPQDFKSKINIEDYDLVLLYSPISVEALSVNYGDDARKIKIAAFGMNTASVAFDRGYNLVSIAPTQKAPSMVNAIEIYIKEYNKKNGNIDLSYIKPTIDEAMQRTDDMFVKVTTTKVRKSSTSKPRK